MAAVLVISISLTSGLKVSRDPHPLTPGYPQSLVFTCRMQMGRGKEKGRDIFFYALTVLKIISDCNKFLQISNPKAGPLWALGSQGMWIKSVVILAAGQRGEDFDYSKIS